MHTEHLQNVRAARVGAGWLVAIAVASLLLLAFLGLDLFTSDGLLTPLGGLAAVAFGFMAGGFFAGFRAIEAPILHGLAIGVTSLVAWAFLNVIASVAFETFEWSALTPGLAVSILVVQMATAVLGALLGYNMALRGRPGLSEHEPLE